MDVNFNRLNKSLSYFHEHQISHSFKPRSMQYIPLLLAFAFTNVTAQFHVRVERVTITHVSYDHDAGIDIPGSDDYKAGVRWQVCYTSDNWASEDTLYDAVDYIPIPKPCLFEYRENAIKWARLYYSYDRCAAWNRHIREKAKIAANAVNVY